MRLKLPPSIGLSALALYCLAAAAPQGNDSQNAPPEVKMSRPAENGAFQWNTLVSYSIDVADSEDGKSEFNEINANEVFLKIAYLPDASQMEKYAVEVSKADDEPLRRMSAANCFTCHTARTKLIGPSFDLIAKRYPDNEASVEFLAKKVLTGAAGTWGNVQMPPHPDLKIEQAREMVAWILKNNADRDRSFAVGLEGAFRTREKPDNASGTGIYVLTASYTDHGPKDTPQRGKQGQHTIVLKQVR